LRRAKAANPGCGPTGASGVPVHRQEAVRRAGRGMSSGLLAIFAAVVLVTTFLAGVFGMAGGVILMAALLFMLPVADAMVLHAMTQIVSNGWRSVLWYRFILWGVLARYALGLLAAGAVFFSFIMIPDERVIFLMLGIVPFLGLMLPQRMVPQADRRFGAELCGFVCTAMQLLSGVSGPLFDVFFVRTDLDRRVIVATKSACQVITHLAKLVYFGVLVGGASDLVGDPAVLAVALSMAVLGTTIARPFLERLTDRTFRQVTTWLVMGIGAIYLVRGVVGFL
jgi:uncharacterized protein